MVEGYIPKSERKKILLLCDDIRMTSGISTMARELVVGTSHKYKWVNLGGAMNHPEQGKKMDISEDTNKYAGISDSEVHIYPVTGYGNPDIVRQLIAMEKPDAIMIFTDPRYWIWLFQMEHEIRQKIPIIYLNIWDDLPYPMYNKPYYQSCDALLAISKQTKNINRVVLGEEAKEKVIKYIPHGINEKHFYPITDDKPEYLALQEFKKKFYKKEYDFTLLWNSRNIRRKATPDVLLAWKIFIDNLPANKAKKCALVLHTQPVDENGTDLHATKEMLFDFNQEEKYNVFFSDQKLGVEHMNLLYNSADAAILISSNEGWGLSITEAMMCGKPIIANVTGGMQDQMRFEDKDGNWIEFTEEFGSNHNGKYKTCGNWAIPVFPNNISLVGSVPTPYIYDDRVDPKQVATAIEKMYTIKISNPSYLEEIGQEAYKWVTSEESMMSAKWMCHNLVEGVEETFVKFKPREKYSIIKVNFPEHSPHFVKYPISQL